MIGPVTVPVNYADDGSFAIGGSFGTGCLRYSVPLALAVAMLGGSFVAGGMQTDCASSVPADLAGAAVSNGGGSGSGNAAISTASSPVPCPRWLHQ